MKDDKKINDFLNNLGRLLDRSVDAMKTGKIIYGDYTIKPSKLCGDYVYVNVVNEDCGVFQGKLEDLKRLLDMKNDEKNEKS